MRVSHFIKALFKTQQCVTLSSAEAELVAMNKAAAELLGMLSMLEDFGEVREGAADSAHDGVYGMIYGDSSAALAVSNRKGCGKLRHIRVGQLWIQERVSEGELQITKVKGTENPADLLTKHVNSHKKTLYCEQFGLVSRLSSN